MIDLHTHSNASDGNLSPAHLAEEAAQKGLTSFALTDHDTLGGLESAALAAKAAGVGFIPGIEISINWGAQDGAPGLGPGGELHLLGLGLRSPSPAFTAAVADLGARRDARNREILDRMHELSIEASWDDVLSLAGGNSHSLGRLHFASLLIRKKIVRNIEQAFSRYLQPGKPLFVPKTGLAFAEAAALIRESGGIPVLAHPMSMFVAWGRLPDLVKALKDRGLAGLEAWHPSAKANACRRLEALGKTLGLHITEGSDFHGEIRPGRRLGYSSRDRQISAAVLDAIPELKP